MATITNLKLSAATRPNSMPAVVMRRNKLAHRIWEQTELVKAQQAGTPFAPTRFRTVEEKDTGL